MTSFVIFFFVLGLVFIGFLFQREITNTDARLQHIASRVEKEGADLEHFLIFLSKIKPLTHKQEIEYIRLHSLIIAKLEAK